MPREPVPGEAYRHARFPYPDGPSRTGSLVKARPHVLRVRALQLLIPATRQRSVAAGPAVVLVVEAGLGHRRHFSWLCLEFLVVPYTRCSGLHIRSLYVLLSE